MHRLKVLISGAGIAGNSLAFWLSKLGHDVTVIERFPTLRVSGLQIDLRGHGVEVMKQMGLEQAFRSKSAPEQGMQVIDSSGRRRAYFPANKSGTGPQNFTTDYEIMRGDLCRLIYDATEGRASYIFGNSIETFEDIGGAVRVRYIDGESDVFDLVVGADGQGSRTRKMMLGPNAPDAFSQLGGMYVAYFTIPRPIKKDEEYIATIYMAPGRRGVMTRRHNPEEVQVYLGGKSDSQRLKNARRGDVKEEKAALAEILKGAGGPIDDILESLEDVQDFYCERIGLVKLDSWYKGRVALVGDAAYCPSANTGMGVSAAVVGAYILAGEIGKTHDTLPEDTNPTSSTVDLVTAALEAYERKFQPFMNQVQKGLSGEDSTWDKIAATSFGIGVLNILAGLASLLKINVGKYMLKEEIKDWELPHYEEMLAGEKLNAHWR